MELVLQVLQGGAARLDLSRRGLTDDDLAALLERPEIARVGELDLGDNDLTDAAVARLARCERLLELTSLDLWANDLTPVAARLLAESPRLPRLRALTVGRNALGDEGVAALAGSAGLDTLESLDLSHCEVTAVGRDALLRSPHVGRVRALVVRGWPFDASAVAALTSSRAWPALEELDFSDNDLGPDAITDDDVEALIRAERLPRLRRVVVLPPRIWGSAGEVDVAEWRARLGATSPGT